MKSRGKRKHQVQLAPDLVVEETMQAGVHRVRRVAPLEYLLRRGAVTDQQYAAGERFRDDYEFGVVGVSETKNGDMSEFARQAPWARSYPEARLGYLESYSGAVRCLPVDSRAVLEAVVARADKSCTDFDRAAGWRTGKAQERLTAGLDCLVRFYAFTR